MRIPIRNDIKCKQTPLLPPIRVICGTPREEALVCAGISSVPGCVVLPRRSHQSIPRNQSVVLLLVLGGGSRIAHPASRIPSARLDCGSTGTHAGRHNNCVRAVVCHTSPGRVICVLSEKAAGRSDVSGMWSVRGRERPSTRSNSFGSRYTASACRAGL